MLLPMLRAVKEMITYSSEEPIEHYKARTQCANTVLSEIICSIEAQNLGGKISEVIENPKLVSKEKTENKASGESKATLETNPKEEYFVTLDEKRGLFIKDFPLGRLVELDGKKMTYQEARGQKFTKARIL
jgi:hypothetical protein